MTIVFYLATLFAINFDLRQKTDSQSTLAVVVAVVAVVVVVVVVVVVL